VSSGELRQAAQRMREQHGPDHVRYGFWSAVATWLEAAATQASYYEAGGAQLHPDSYALNVARAYVASTATCEKRHE
jgi:hypothetical protein